MALTPDTVIDAFWHAVDEMPANALAPPIALRLLAGLCGRLGLVEPSERLAEEARECLQTADEYTKLLSGEGVPLVYAYSATGDGYVVLETFNAEGTAAGESGTVVGKPGVRVWFNAAEARRAVQILGTLFPPFGVGGSAESQYRLGSQERTAREGERS